MEFVSASNASIGWSDVNYTLIGSEDSNETARPVYPVVRQPVHMIALFSLSYALIFVLGLCGNLLVISVVVRNPRMHNVTNYFIVNLAVADICVCLLVVPITLLSNIYTGWVFGAVMCKLAPFMQGVSVCASVSTLTAISIDRYLAICFTLKYRMTRRTARIAILVVWFGSLALMAPWAVYYQRSVYDRSPTHTIYVCDQYWPSKRAEKAYFLAAILLACYSIPLVLISLCYTFIALRVWNRNAPGIANTSAAVLKSKIKVLKMLVVVVVMFATSWLPLYAIRIRLYFGADLHATSREFFYLTQIIVPVAQWLGSANSCVNPIIYCLFSKKFRQGFSVIVLCCRSRPPPTPWIRNSSLLYRSVCDHDPPLSMYSSLRHQLASDTRAKLDISEEQTCF